MLFFARLPLDPLLVKLLEKRFMIPDCFSLFRKRKLNQKIFPVISLQFFWLVLIHILLLKKWKSFYDFTMMGRKYIFLFYSGRRDSGVFYPYAEVLHRKPIPEGSHLVQFYLKVKDILPQKRRLALALVSNCADTKGAKARGVYIKNLVKVSPHFVSFFGFDSPIVVYLSPTHRCYIFG